MRITVHGTGYVGLVTGACLSDVGNQVLCVDVDEGKVQDLRAGRIPIYEPGLEEIVRRNAAGGRLEFTSDVARGVAHGPFQFIAVGTPKDEDGSADLGHVLTVARSIGQEMADYKVVVTKSTVPVGTGDKVRQAVADALAQRLASIEFDVVSNPEFLKEGAAVGDFMKPDRIIVGSDTARATEMLRDLYEPFGRNRDKVIVMDLRSAELTKYAANAMLATKISFMNELANMAEACGADIEQVRIGIGSDPRIGFEFIYPGCGYGGSCFPKDVSALVRSARDHGADMELVRAVDNVNARQKEVLIKKIGKFFNDQLKDRTIALWGLAFKPDTDDMREASSRVLMEKAWHSGARIRAYDPKALDEARHIYGDRSDLTYCRSSTEALEGADVLAVVTEWREFRSPDFELIRDRLAHKAVFDGRNIYDPAMVRRAGLRYFGIGRGDAAGPVTAVGKAFPRSR
ncbi:MAG: UDP-glucose/GDP-mannose dehydrogenase family protein [Gammaproteobacteria bacterium]|nr:UDP-glucose/GDP-mannose dehydrogenase family protein [Gammaproteobacteria bacterium]